MRTGMLRPVNDIMNHDNPVKMVRHDREFIRRRVWKKSRDLFPLMFHNYAEFIQTHIPVDNIPKQAFPIVCADGYEIPSRLGIIVSFQTDGTPMVDLKIVFHGPVCPHAHGLQGRVEKETPERQAGVDAVHLQPKIGFSPRIVKGKPNDLLSIPAVCSAVFSTHSAYPCGYGHPGYKNARQIKKLLHL